MSRAKLKNSIEVTVSRAIKRFQKEKEEKDYGKNRKRDSADRGFPDIG